jgi:hypothetical protein
VVKFIGSSLFIINFKYSISSILSFGVALLALNDLRKGLALLCLREAFPKPLAFSLLLGLNKSLVLLL